MSWIRKAHQGTQWFLRTLDTHPLTLSAATVTGFTLAGLVSWTLFDFLEGSRAGTGTPKGQRPLMSLEEARLRAMIENAKEASSWQENLDKAAAAQEQFMLPGRPREGVPRFMMDIERRSRELLKEDQAARAFEAAQAKKDEGDEWFGGTPKRSNTKTRMWKD